MTTAQEAQLHGNAVAWVSAVVSVVVDGGNPPPSRRTLYRRVPQQVGGGASAPVDGGPSARGDGRSTAALNGLRQKDFKAGQRIWIDAVVDELVAQGAVAQNGGELTWARDLHRDMTVTFRGKTIRVSTPEERQRSEELGAVDLTLRGAGHLNRVRIAEGGGLSNNARFRQGQRVKLEVHPLAYELPPMGAAELERMAEDVKRHGIVMPLLLIPDHDDPLRKQTAKPGEQPLVRDKQGKPLPKLKVGDGRHRLFLASQYDLPVRLELFEGTEQEARERIVSLNVHRRMLDQVTIGALIRKLLLPAEKRKAKERKQEGRRKGGGDNRSRANLPTSAPAPEGNGRAEKRVLDAVGNPIGERTLRTLEPLDDAPDTMAKALRGEYRSAAKARRDAIQEKARREGQPEPEVPPQAKSRGDRYSTALKELRHARREFDPEFKGQLTSQDRVERLRSIIAQAEALIELETANGPSG